MLPRDLAYWLSWSCFLKVGPVKFKRLLDFFGTAEKAFFAQANSLVQAGLEPLLVEEFIAFRQRYQYTTILHAMQQEQIALCPITSELYPPLLRQIHNPPFLIYIKGDLSFLQNGFPMAIVGTRRASQYGARVAYELSQGLAKQGISIISGGAQGIDTYAHQGTLKAGGKTVAVLGCGIDEASYFPKTNIQLFREIIARGGAVISELPPGTQAQTFTFPHRNRIISGISMGCVVVEAPEKSGALITANCALEQNREVFAVPNSVYNPNSLGPHSLLKQGAQLVSCAKDVLDAFNIKAVSSIQEARATYPKTPKEEKILSLLTKEPTHIDALARLSGFPASEVSATLTTMELKGMVRNLGGMQYVKTA